MSDHNAAWDAARWGNYHINTTGTPGQGGSIHNVFLFIVTFDMGPSPGLGELVEMAVKSGRTVKLGTG